MRLVPVKKKSYAEILGAAVPATKMAQASVFYDDQGNAHAGPVMAALGLTVLGGIVGHEVWKRHPVLGAIAGMTIGSVAVPITKGTHGDKVDALEHAIATGSGLALSLGWKKHPALGFILGEIGGGLLGDAVLVKTEKTSIEGAVNYYDFNPNQTYSKGDNVSTTANGRTMQWEALQNVPAGIIPGLSGANEYWFFVGIVAG